MSDERVWTVEIVLTESADQTHANAFLRGGEHELSGWGRSRRNPADPDVPLVGDELAVARALSDLSHQLVLAALEAIEAFELPSEPSGGLRKPSHDARGIPPAT
jgi:hypothetical protein